MANYSEVEIRAEAEAEPGVEAEEEANDSYVNAALEDGHTDETSVQRSYATVLTETDIRERVRRDIQSVSEFTSLSEEETTILLSHFRWDVNDIHERWSADANRVREIAGLLELDPSSDDIIGVCDHSLTHENFASVSCGHRICTYCWTTHLNNIINESPAAEWNLLLKCPTPVGPYGSCQASVGRGMIERFASQEEKSMYDQHFLRYYVDSNETMKWHPIRGSSCAIDLGPDSGNPNVSCLRLLRFCWNCKEDAHSPVDCIKAAEWVQEIMKPCPKCQLMIQRNQDFSLKMTCLPCNYEFCWYCHVDWIDHGFNLCGGSSTVQRGEIKDCYDNWKSYESLMVTAEDYLQNLDTAIENLSITQLPTIPQLNFILDAGLQIIECTRFLKWTYVYGYYLREDEVGKQNFLMHSRGTAESLLSMIDDCLKTDLPPLLDAEGTSPSFNIFRIKLTEQTSTARGYYEDLVIDLENGLASVESVSERTQTAYDGEASGSGHIHND